MYGQSYIFFFVFAILVCSCFFFSGIAIFLCATVLCSTDTDNRNEVLVENTEEFGTNSDSSGSNEIELKNLHLAQSSNTIKDDTESESAKDGKEPVTVTDEQLQSRDKNVDITDTDKTGVENSEHETQGTQYRTGILIRVHFDNLSYITLNT